MGKVYKEFELSNPADVQLLNDIENIGNMRQQISSMSALIEEQKKKIADLENSKNDYSVLNEKDFNQCLSKLENLKIIIKDICFFLEGDPKIDLNPQYREPFNIIRDFISMKLKDNGVEI